MENVASKPEPTKYPARSASAGGVSKRQNYFCAYVSKSSTLEVMLGHKPARPAFQPVTSGVKYVLLLTTKTFTAKEASGHAGI